MGPFLMLVTLLGCVSLSQATTVTSFNADIFSRFLISNYYGQEQHPNCRRRELIPGVRRCQKPDNSIAPLLYLAAFQTTTKPGCFPDSSTFERQRADGTFEIVPITSLALGDMVKCLLAPMGPVTRHPSLGACKYISVNHQDTNGTEYVQVVYQENGVNKMLALTPAHLMWSSRDNTIKGMVNAETLKITNDMFVESRLIRIGDVIIVDVNNTLQYRTVTAVYQQFMPGQHNPQFLGGGLIFVDGIMATTTASPLIGGHWGAYYKQGWFQDYKFVDPATSLTALFTNPYYHGEWMGNITVNQDCFMTEIINALRAGIDVTNYVDYTSFAQAYVLPCSKFTTTQQFSAVDNLKQVLGFANGPLVPDVESLEQAFDTPRMVSSGGR